MSKSIHDLTDQELVELLRNRSEFVDLSASNCLDEMHWRSQDRNTRALNRWTVVITIATVINTVAAVIQALAATGYFKQ